MKCNHALTDANNPTGKSWKHNCALCEIDHLRSALIQILTDKYSSPEVLREMAKNGLDGKQWPSE